MSCADAVPAGSRPDRPLEALSPAEGQDPGLHRSRGRPLQDAHDPCARDDRDLARRGAGPPAERRPRRGDRARTRHGPHPVRACGRAGARRGVAGAIRQRLPAQRAIPSDRTPPQPHPRGLRRHSHAHRAAGAGDAGGQDRPYRRPHRVRQPRHRRRCALRAAHGGRPPGRRDRAPRDDRAEAGSTRSSTISWSRPRRPATSSRARRSATRCCPCARSCSSASTSAPRSSRSTARPSGWCARSSPGSRTSPSCCRRETERSRSRITDYLAGMTDRFALAYAERLSAE